MIWKTSDEIDSSTQTPVQTPPRPTAPQNQPQSATGRAWIGCSIKIVGSSIMMMTLRDIKFKALKTQYLGLDKPISKYYVDDTNFIPGIG